MALAAGLSGLGYSAWQHSGDGGPSAISVAREAPRPRSVDARAAGVEAPSSKATDRDAASGTAEPGASFVPRLAWRFRSAAPASGAPAIGSSGEVYVTSVEGYVHALAADGTFRWSRSVSGAPIGSPLVDDSGQLYVATREQRIYGIRPDGRLSWTFRSPVRIVTPLSWGAPGVLHYAGHDNRLYAVTSWGRALWSRALNADVTAAANLGGRLAVATERPELWLSSKGGLSRVSLPAPSRQLLASAEGRLYAVASKELLAIDPSDGSPRDLRFPADRAGLSADGRWIVVQTGRQISWLASDGGRLLHGAELPGDASGPPAVSNAGIAFVPMVSGDLIALGPGQSAATRVNVGRSPVWPPRWDESSQRVAVASSGMIACIEIEAGSPRALPASSARAKPEAD